MRITQLETNGVVFNVPVRVQWEPVTGAFAAYEDAFELWFGLGETEEAALQDLGEVLGETFRDLESLEAQLAPPLQRRLAQLREVVAMGAA